MSTASMDSFSSESDLEYTDSELSSEIISIGVLCVAEKKQVGLRDVSFHLESAQKVDSWLDKLCMGQILSMAAEVQKKGMDKCISVSGVVGQGLPPSPDESEDGSFSQQLNSIVSKTNDAPLVFADRHDCRERGRPDKFEVLPAVQLDPHSALREARRLMTVYRDYVPPQHAELAIPHVWARRLALALEGDLPDEALARFAVLTKNERHLVTQGIFELKNVESGECRDTWEQTEPGALWPEDVFAGAARVLDVQLRKYVEARAYEKEGDIEEEADIAEEAWPSADDTLARDIHWNRVPSGCPEAVSPIDTTKSARVEDDSPQSIPRVEFRIGAESFLDPCRRDHSAVPTIWLCLGTRYIEDQGSKGEKPTHGYRVVKPISVREKLMLADAVMLLGAESISKMPELYLI